ncbi:MAG: glycosyltransferase [Thermodesulfobacteriota bacterium]
MQSNNGQTIVTNLEKFQAQEIYHAEDFAPFLGKERVEELKKLAGPLEGKGWTNVNSTLIGGGVAEMLQSAVPLAQGLGLDANWYVIRGNEDFFQVTKKFHNMLQGMDLPITLEEIFKAYLNTIDENAKNTFIASDLVVIHDPQPAAMVMNGLIFGNILWRCHIDTSGPNEIIWRFLLPYINQCAGAIFTIPEFVGPGLQVPLYQIYPCINPLAPKNEQLSQDQALDILQPLFNEHDLDANRPIVAAVSRYDIHKNQKTIIKSFQKYKERFKPDPAPYLIFLGNTASDDPEGEAMFQELKSQAGEDPDIRFWVNVQNNDRVVGALMHLAQVFVHVSTREGFGLVVTEAMWQGTPVIGSKVGGIVKQVVDSQTGYLVQPLDEEDIMLKMQDLLSDPEKARAMGERAREHVRTHFLIPELVRRYLVLLQYYSGVGSQMPEFRLNDLSYSELLNIMRPTPPFLRQK